MTRCVAYHLDTGRRCTQRVAPTGLGEWLWLGTDHARRVGIFVGGTREQRLACANADWNDIREIEGQS